MNPATIVACVALCVGAAMGSDVAFCYNDAEGCGPSTHAWADTCHSGQRQSPIELPTSLKSTGLTTLRMIGAYRGDSFRMQNNGHSVSIDFVGASGKNEGPSAKPFAFPDPLSTNKGGYTKQNVLQYRFGSAHFHWGKTNNVGSEHCLGSQCAALELHLVHYLANYSSQAEAVASGKENALTVLGVMANAKYLNSLIGSVGENQGHPSLAPIVNNLDQVHHASHDGGYVTINEPLDLTRFILTEDPVEVYSYKGSLTTPGCNEQVNWFVVKKPNAIDESDLEAFRSKLQDSRSQTLAENHRPTMPINGRRVHLSTVIPSL